MIAFGNLSAPGATKAADASASLPIPYTLYRSPESRALFLPPFALATLSESGFSALAENRVSRLGAIPKGKRRSFFG